MYLDPNFGSMLIQMIIAAVAAGGAYAVIFRNRIKAFFARKKKGADAPAVSSDEKSDEEK